MVNPSVMGSMTNSIPMVCLELTPWSAHMIRVLERVDSMKTSCVSTMYGHVWAALIAEADDYYKGQH